MPCPACEGTFRTEAALRRHIKTSHPLLLADEQQAKSVNSFISTIYDAAYSSVNNDSSGRERLASFFYQKIKEDEDAKEGDGRKRRSATVIQVRNALFE